MNSNTKSLKEDLMYKARLAERTLRFPDLLSYLFQLVELQPQLSREERDLFVAGFKGFLAPKRDSMNVLSTYLERNSEEEPSVENSLKTSILRNFIGNIRVEIDSVCNHAVNTIDNKLLPCNASDSRAQIFYLKMKGDLFRYKAEYDQSQGSHAAAQALAAYTAALELSSNCLCKADVLHLGLVLNFSVFMYEILGRKSTAIEFATTSLGKAMANTDELTDLEYADSVKVLQLIKDNIEEWEFEEVDDTEDVEYLDETDGDDEGDESIDNYDNQNSQLVEMEFQHIPFFLRQTRGQEA